VTSTIWGAKNRLGHQVNAWNGEGFTTMPGSYG
jgi:hypothetical protein